MNELQHNAPGSLRVFETSHSKLEGRWDPLYYERDIYYFLSGSGTLVPLGSQLLMTRTGFAAGKSEQSDEENGLIQIRPTNLSEDHSLVFQRNIYISRRRIESNSQDLLERGEVLFNNTNSQELVGKTVLFDLEGDFFASNHITRLRVNDELLNNEFLACLLNLYQARGVFYRLCTNWNNQSGVSPQTLARVLVPSIDMYQQRVVADRWRRALQVKKDQESLANHLLASIDDMLLDELGIPRKPEPPNTLELRIFQRYFSSLSGKRIDPSANWKELSFDGGRFPLRRLKDIVSINPETHFPRLAPGTPVSFVPMDAVSEVFGEIEDRQTRTIEGAGSYTRFQNGDVIWAKITPCMENGKAAVADGLVEGVGYGSTEFHVFRRRTSELVPHYLHHLLRLRTIREHARRNFTGSSGHQRVDGDFFSRMEIPFPPMKIQKQIAEKAESAISHARKLFADAHIDLEEAKREIEALILDKEATE